jgi:hypothetical protein
MSTLGVGTCNQLFQKEPAIHRLPGVSIKLFEREYDLAFGRQPSGANWLTGINKETGAGLLLTAFDGARVRRGGDHQAGRDDRGVFRDQAVPVRDRSPRIYRTFGRTGSKEHRNEARTRGAFAVEPGEDR